MKNKLLLLLGFLSPLTFLSAHPGPDVSESVNVVSFRDHDGAQKIGIKIKGEAALKLWRSLSELPILRRGSSLPAEGFEILALMRNGKNVSCGVFMKPHQENDFNAGKTENIQFKCEMLFQPDGTAEVPHT